MPSFTPSGMLYGRRDIILPPVVPSPTAVVGLYTWYRADTGATVSQWDPKAGANLPLVQGTAGNQPTLTASNANFNNLPTMDFDGVDNFMQAASYVLPQPYTFYMVFRMQATGGNQSALGRDGGGWRIVMVPATPEILMGNAAPDLSATGSTLASPYKKTWIGSSSSGGAYLRISGTTITGSSGGQIGSGTLTVGAFWPGTISQYAAVEIADLAFYTRQLNSQDIALLEAYTLARYGFI